MTGKHYDLVIIGAGITGASVARLMSSYHLKILVLEKENDVSMGSTKANSAIVHGGYAESSSTLRGRLCYQGRKEFRKLNEELNFGFDPVGSFVLAFREEDRKGLMEEYENGLRNGVPDLRILEGEEVLRMEPALNPEVKAALYCEGAGITSPYEMCIALMENAIENGVTLRLNTPCLGIRRREKDYEIDLPNGERITSSFIVNAAGCSADRISSLLAPSSYKIHPRSGEYLLMARGTGSLLKHVSFQMPTKMGKGILVTPTYHGNLLLGPDAHDEGEITGDTHVDRLCHIYHEALKTVSPIPIRQFIRSFTGFRAVSDTGDFVIEEKDGFPGFIEAGGIQSPGLTSSPAIARMVRDLLYDAGLSLREKESFQPKRRPIIERKTLLGPKAIAPLLELPEGDPRRMVCRCEEVTEAVIRDSASRGIPLCSIDAVKRRTRAGMGWCQGSFCRPRVAALLRSITGQEIDPSFDTEHSGIQRVGKTDFLKALKEHGEVLS